MNYFKIKVGNPDAIKRAKLIIFFGFSNNGTIYKTMSFDEKDALFSYLEKCGCEPEYVSRVYFKE